MKKRNLLWLFVTLLGFSLFTVSCGKDDTDNEDTPQNVGVIELSFNEGGTTKTVKMEGARDVNVSIDKAGAEAYGWISSSGLWVMGYNFYSSTDLDQFYCNMGSIEEGSEYTVSDTWVGWEPTIDWSTNIEGETDILVGYEYSLAPGSVIEITKYTEDTYVEGTITGTGYNNETDEEITDVSGTFKVYLD